jgi:hypothetical protein
MEIFRVKQISENQFIPQVCNDIIDWLFGTWDGIDVSENVGKDVGGGTFTWLSKECQEQYCIVDSLEKAKEVIENYRKRFNSEKGYPKYHKA